MRTNTRDKINKFIGKVIEFPMDKIPKRRPCLYFLIYENEIVYIGVSVALPQRLYAHLQKKKFDEVYFADIPNEDELYQMETLAIKHFRPRLNGTDNPDWKNHMAAKVKKRQKKREIEKAKENIKYCFLCKKKVNLSYQCQKCNRYLNKQQIKLCVRCHKKYCSKKPKKPMLDF